MCTYVRVCNWQTPMPSLLIQLLDNATFTAIITKNHNLPTWNCQLFFHARLHVLACAVTNSTYHRRPSQGKRAAWAATLLSVMVPGSALHAATKAKKLSKSEALPVTLRVHTWLRANWNQHLLSLQELWTDKQDHWAHVLTALQLLPILSMWVCKQEVWGPLRHMPLLRQLCKQGICCVYEYEQG